MRKEVIDGWILIATTVAVVVGSGVILVLTFKNPNGRKKL